MAKEYKLSPERLKELQEELIYLTIHLKRVAGDLQEVST